jgi:arylsulfatase A
MKRFSMITLTLALAGAGLPVQAAAPEKPNIVFILIDDMGYGDIGPFGSTKNRTPQLDRMAKEGMRLTSFYAAPVCSVSRAQVISGCYGQRVSLPGVLFPGCPNGINAKEHTVAELVRTQGYTTMCIGKWHLGDQPEFLPTRHGFNHYFGIPYSNDMQSRVAKEDRSVVPLVRDDKLVEQLAGDDQNRLTERYTEEAVKFIRENQARPFFLYLPHTAVHVPIHPGEKFRGKSQNGRYGDWVEEVDWSVGRVLDTLRELKLDNRTLVIFSSDNGPWLTQGKDGGEAGPLRGGKGSTFEGGVRVPTIAWWPGTIAPGSACDAVAANIDLLPTFVSLVGGSVSPDRKIDGRDLSPLLLGRTKESPREAHFYYRGYKLEAVRCGPWKLALGPQAEAMWGQTSPDASAPGVRLYNLDEEIGERTNVAAEHPEVVKRLQALATKMAADLGDGKPGPGVRPAGRVEHPALLIPGAEPRTPKKSPKPARPVVLPENLKIGDTLAADSAPQVAGQALSITFQIAPKAPSGVIVAQGGSAVGYALYLKDNRLVFVVRRSAEDITRITSAEIPAGRLSVEARLGGDGTMTLAVNGKPVAKGKAGGLIDRQPMEDFCVGHDNRMPLDAYDGKTRFAGSIEQLKVLTGKQP